ncbi:MAG: tetratricopeptide repeat protein [Bacillota bacterium]
MKMLSKKGQKGVFWVLTIFIGLGLIASSVVWTLPDLGSAPGPTQEQQETSQSQQPVTAVNKELESRIKNNPSDVAARLQLAAWYRDGGDLEKAIAQYEEVIKLDAVNQNARLSLAELYYLTGQVDLALAQFDEILKVNPDHQLALFRSALMLGQEKNDYQAAAERLQRYIEVAGPGPETDQARMLLEVWQKKE